MKNCMYCRHAVWEETKNGRLHPSGKGRCEFPYKLKPLPASMYWPYNAIRVPEGGEINRNEELLEHCTYYDAP